MPLNIIVINNGGGGAVVTSNDEFGAFTIAFAGLSVDSVAHSLRCRDDVVDEDNVCCFADVNCRLIILVRCLLSVLVGTRPST